MLVFALIAAVGLLTMVVRFAVDPARAIMTLIQVTMFIAMATGLIIGFSTGQWGDFSMQFQFTPVNLAVWGGLIWFVLTVLRTLPQSRPLPPAPFEAPPEAPAAQGCPCCTHHQAHHDEVANGWPEHQNMHR